MEHPLKTLEYSFKTLKILERFVIGSMKSNFMEIILSGYYWEQAFLACLLLAYTNCFGLPLNHEWPLKVLPNHSLFVISNCNSLMANVDNVAYRWMAAAHNFQAGLHEEGNFCWCFWNPPECCNQSDYRAMVNCNVALCIEKVTGKLSRKAYLEQASRTCPQLILPDAHVMREEFLEKFTRGNKLHLLSQNSKVHIWDTLLRFRIDDQIEEVGDVDNETLRAAHLLSNILQHQQRWL